MADPQAALLSQVRNIQTKTGLSLAQLHEQLAASGLAKHGEKRSWLMERFQLGYGDANTVVHLQGQVLPGLGDATGAAEPSPAAAPAGGDALDAIYGGKKAALRGLHQALMAQISALGDFEIAPKKSYLSLRRSKQFAMVGPATAGEIEIGINCKTLAPHARLKPLPPGGMCQATTRISTAAQIDAELMGWLGQAYAAAA